MAKKSETVNWMEQFKGMNSDQKLKAIIDRIRSINEDKKKLTAEDSAIKNFVRDLATKQRSAGELSVDMGHGCTVAFQRPIPKDMDKKKATTLKAAFIGVLKDAGEKLFKKLFERPDKYKPIGGFSDAFDELDAKDRDKIKDLIDWKKTTPLVQT